MTILYNEKYINGRQQNKDMLYVRIEVYDELLKKYEKLKYETKGE